MIHVQNLTVSYHRHNVINELSLDIHQGECVLITGPKVVEKAPWRRR
jgi:ABC-type cobalamin/Fe3+-siderophores transport system ATPase subunit